MIFNIRFLPEVEDDLFSGFSWYEGKSSGLGEEFLRIFYASSNSLTRNALLYKKVYGDFRRILFKTLPICYLFFN